MTLRDAHRAFVALHRKLKRSPSMAEYGAAIGLHRTTAHLWAKRLADEGLLERVPLAYGSAFVPRRRAS
jgi:hypothetical protein